MSATARGRWLTPQVDLGVRSPPPADAILNCVADCCHLQERLPDLAGRRHRRRRAALRLCRNRWHSP